MSSEDDDDGLTSEQFRWLGFVAIALGALVLLSVLGVTAASVLYGGDDAGDAPVAGFDVQTADRGDGVATNVTHGGGDGIDPDSLVVEVNDERRGTWEELGGEGYGVVAPGHSLVLGNVSAGDRVAVVWTGDGQDVGLGDGVVQSADDGGA